MHPVNVKRAVIETLLSAYEPLYRRDFYYEGNYPTDEGVYFIGVKKSGLVLPSPMNLSPGQDEKLSTGQAGQRWSIFDAVHEQAIVPGVVRPQPARQH